MSGHRTHVGGTPSFPRTLVGAVTVFVAAYAVFVVGLIVAVVGVAAAAPELWDILFGSWCERVDGASVSTPGCSGAGIRARLSGFAGELGGALIRPWRTGEWPWWLAGFAALYAGTLALALFARDENRSAR